MEFSKKLFILGSTGYIGNHIMQEYLKNGYEVTTIVRSKDKVQSINNVTVLDGNTNDLDYLKSVGQNFDVYIFASGGTPEESEKVMRVMLDLSEATANSVHSSKFIYCSGCFVYGNNDSLQSEDSKCDNPVKSVAWKRPVEDYILSLNGTNTKYTFSTAVIRPSWVYGNKNDNYMNNYLRFCRDNSKVVVPKTCATYISLTHIEDCARLFYLVGNTEGAKGIYNSCDGVSLKVKEFADAVAKHLKVEVTYEEDSSPTLGGFEGLFVYAFKLSFNLESKRSKDLGHELRFNSFTEKISEIFESL